MIKHLLTALFGLFSIFATTQDLYEISNITEIKITFDDPNWDATMDTFYANDLDELLYGNCEINGLMYDSVGVAFKGNSTYNINNDKNPLKLKLAEVYDQNHHGFQTLKLANGDKDPTFVREVLGYEIGRKYMDMPLSNYAVVYINDDLYGLFSSTESVNGDFLESRFYCDRDNVRIKCNPTYGSGGNGPSLEYLGADTALYYNSYEIKSDFGWTALMNFTNNLANNIANVESFLDVDRAIWMLAYNNVIVNLDSYTGPIRQNYYLVQDDNGRMIPIIWDLNGCFGAFTMLNGAGPGFPPTSLADILQMDPYLRENDAVWPLIYKLFAVAEYRKKYMAHCRTIYEENLLNASYYTRAQELQAIIASDVIADSNAFYSYSDFTNNLDVQVGSGPAVKFGLAEVADGRAAYLSSYAAYGLVQPTISAVQPSSTQPLANSTVTITADITTANYVYLRYRFYKADAFQKTEMFDDGAHNDGAAGDGTYGVDVLLGASDIQYYIYAENGDAGKFSPVRAEHEFYDLTLTAGVVINELQPSNNVTAADQDGEFNDWIELYNNTNASIDLSGYFLTDDELIINKWIFPTGTTIAANDYLIVWADNDILQAGLHAGFKLSSSGETILLSDPSGNPINSVSYPLVADNMTYGRYANGTGGFIPMMPTHSAENEFTAISVEEEVLESKVLKVYPNPATDQITLEFNSDDSQLVQLFNLSGQLMFSDNLYATDQIDMGELERGVYILFIPSLGMSTKIILK